MLDNGARSNYRMSTILHSDAERLVSNFSNTSSARELARLIALGIGVPVDNMHDIHNLGTAGIMGLMYLYEKEYCGSVSKPGVWGQDYTNSLLGNRRTTGSRGIVERSSLWFRSEVEVTDMVCISYMCALGRGGWFLFTKMLESNIDTLNKESFSGFIRYLVVNNLVGSIHMVDLLLKINDGNVLKSIMDTLHASSSEQRIKGMLINMKGDRRFNSLCEHVTSRIAASLTAAGEASA